MSDGSQIQWTDATWNPTTGCTKVSPGCAHCYIERTPAFRIHGRKFVNGATDLRLHANRLDQPLRWRKPRRVFVNSLSDLFHDDVPDVFIERVFSVMALAERHTFQVLTKRPDRMLAWFRARRFDATDYAILQTEMEGECLYAHPWPLPNVWLGVSVENQHFADARIPVLLQTPAAVRFISAEPLLGPVTLAQFYNGGVTRDWLRGDTRLSWVIVGGESGPKSRPFDLAWGRAIVAQCQAAGVPVFVKQLGAKPFTPIYCSNDGAGCIPPHGREQFARNGLRLHDKKGGDMAEWPEDLRVRQFPASWSTTPARSQKERTTKS